MERQDYPVSYIVQHLPVGSIRVPDLHEQFFGDSDPDEFSDLVESVKRYGVLQPLLVKKSREQPGMYDVVAGSRRLKAAARAGLTKVPCLVLSQCDADDLNAIAIVTNTTTRTLSLVQKLRCWKRLSDMFPDMPLHSFDKHVRAKRPADHYPDSIDERYRTAYERARQLAEQTGMSPAEAEKLLPILQLPSVIRHRIDQGWISPALALLIASNSPNDLAALESLCRVSVNKSELQRRVKAMLARISGHIRIGRKDANKQLLKAMSDWLWSVELEASDEPGLKLWHTIRDAALSLANWCGLRFLLRIPRVPRISKSD